MSPESSPSTVPAPPRTARRRRGPVATLLLSLVVTAFDAVLLALALGGFDRLAAHPRALALIAIWAVTGATLALLRPVGAQDVVQVSPESRLLLIGLGLVPVFTPPIAALGERLGLWLLPGGLVVRWLGVVLVAAGLSLRIAAMAQLGPRFSPLVAVQREHALETHGLYQWIRHPGYLGAWFAALGAVMAFGSALGLIPLVLFGQLLIWRARREEALLAARFGDSWAAYRAHTGAFFPPV